MAIREGKKINRCKHYHVVQSKQTNWNRTATTIVTPLSLFMLTKTTPMRLKMQNKIIIAKKDIHTISRDQWAITLISINLSIVNVISIQINERVTTTTINITKATKIKAKAFVYRWQANRNQRLMHTYISGKEIEHGGFTSCCFTALQIQIHMIRQPDSFERAECSNKLRCFFRICFGFW